VDVDQDGLLDVVSASSASNGILSIHYPLMEHAVTMAAGDSVVLSSAVLQVTDPDTPPAALRYELGSLPAQGELRLSGAPLGVGDSFTQDDVDSLRVLYVHDGFGSGTDRLDLEVSDGTTIRRAALRVRAITQADWLGHYAFEEGAGTTAVDGSGNGHDGVLLNGPVFVGDTPDGSSFALRFDGSDDEHVFMLSTTAADGATRLRARLRFGGVTQTLIAPRGNLSTGVWHHVALTYDQQILRLFLDGEEVLSTTQAGVIDQDPALAVAIGGQPTGAGSKNRFDGLMDDVRLYQYGLRPDEIRAIFESAVP
jgi:hypothetical protein